ncbi:MAG: thymidine phosphorylase [Candidatus Acidiferrales bacterium]
MLASLTSRRMRAVDIIRKKRDAGELTREEIEFLIRGATDDSVPDYQLAAWLMAVVWRGMSQAELAALTEAMLHSGQVLDLSDVPGVKVDKHSTGGVGDKTSLVIAPIVAAAGLPVPMISGRGLGHTGGTLDKLEAIPGFNVNLSLADFRRVLKECGCALIGQTPEIAPADKKLYSLRDVTATVESPYLICASIMSKKLAEGIDALVLDVKTGDGAFMKKEADAVYLAELMVETGKRMGKKIVALITVMEPPLGRKVGKALAVEECLEMLAGGGPEDLRELCLDLSAWMLTLGGKCKKVSQGREIAAEMISNGRARDKFREIIRLQGGDAGVVDDPGRLPKAKQMAKAFTMKAGYITAIRCEHVGIASMLLGGGREKKEDSIDPAVGVVLEKKVGDEVKAGSALCTIHFNSEERKGEALAMLGMSFVIGPKKPAARPLVRRIIGAKELA